jgi:hypothetical protein
MQITENISTASTMVPSCKVGEVSCAGGFVADGRFRVRLQEKVN